MLRRDFIKAGLGAGLAIGAGDVLARNVPAPAAGQTRARTVRNLTEPAAIATGATPTGANG